jgi:hypothetical protein
MTVYVLWLVLGRGGGWWGRREREGGVERGVERREREKKNVHSAQFGDEAMVEVICLFSALREGFDEGSSRISSWRFEGGRVKRRGRAIFSFAFVSVGRRVTL